MEKISSFIVNNWQFISAGFILLFQIILIFCKKRPKTLDDFMVCLDKVLNHLPVLINDAENDLSSLRNKPFKKSCVINNAMVYFSHLLKRDISPYECDFAEKAISEQIESILSTPTKKGGLGREETIEEKI